MTGRNSTRQERKHVSLRGWDDRDYRATLGANGWTVEARTFYGQPWYLVAEGFATLAEAKAHIA